jgi:hypothetical protein
MVALALVSATPVSAAEPTLASLASRTVHDVPGLDPPDKTVVETLGERYGWPDDQVGKLPMLTREWNALADEKWATLELMPFPNAQLANWWRTGWRDSANRAHRVPVAGMPRGVVVWRRVTGGPRPQDTITILRGRYLAILGTSPGLLSDAQVRALATKQYDLLPQPGRVPSPRIHFALRAEQLLGVAGIIYLLARRRQERRKRAAAATVEAGPSW